MFQTKQLSEDQKSTIHQWAEDGATMADIQRLVEETWSIRITYMDTRFLILDLGITLKQEIKEEPKKEEPALIDADDDVISVQLQRDAIVIPGMLYSGKVTFSDGQRAMWYVDETGRLGLDPDTADYRPSPEDIAVFQNELKKILR